MPIDKIVELYGYTTDLSDNGNSFFDQVVDFLIADHIVQTLDGIHISYVHG